MTLLCVLVSTVYRYTLRACCGRDDNQLTYPGEARAVG